MLTYSSTGSGVETTSHLYEPNNGRIVVMFQAFEGAPRIIRLWGKGRVLERFNPDFNAFVGEWDVKVIPATRSIIVVDVHQVGTSCGFSVPFYDFKGFRNTLNDHFAKKERSYLNGKRERGYGCVSTNSVAVLFLIVSILTIYVATGHSSLNSPSTVSQA